MKRTSLLLAILWLMFSPSAHAELQIHFLDVGQGDAAIILCDGESMMIDGGPAGASQFIYSYLRNTLNLEQLDFMVATHPHEDHIGGLSAALNAVPVELIISSTLEYDSRAFSSMLKYADAQGTPIVTASDGDSWYVGNALVTVVVCWPEAPVINDTSIIFRIDYGDTSFLFTGDAEAMEEYIAIDSPIPLKADVLKVAHHGSQSSSSLEFLESVAPAYAVISCGRGNSYGHPHRVTLNNLQSIGTSIFRTDLQGTIICTTDGSDINWSTEFSSTLDDILSTNDSEVSP